MKVNKIVEISLLSIFLLVLFACHKEKGHEFITFINNSEDSVFVSWDSYWVKTNPADALCEGAPQTKVLKDSSYQLKPVRDGFSLWEWELKGRPFIQFFVFPNYKFTYSSCEEVQKHLLKRYQLTEADLDSLNWTITYP